MIAAFRGAWSYLSNFHPSPILSADGIAYPTVEHYFQAHKSLDNDWRLRVAAAETPSRAKYLGRSVSLRPEWDAVKLGVMRKGLALKFDPDSELARWLLGTGDHYLEEGNTWGDRFWGVVSGQGENWLGHLLMARRAELRGGY